MDETMKQNNRHDKLLGYSLLEIIVAMGILLLSFMTLVFLFMLSYRETLYQTQRIIATDLAVAQIEQLKTAQFNDLQSGQEESVVGYPDFRRTWIIHVQSDNSYLKKITVTVEWKNKQTRSLLIILTTYMSKI